MAQRERLRRRAAVDARHAVRPRHRLSLCAEGDLQGRRWRGARAARAVGVQSWRGRDVARPRGQRDQGAGGLLLRLHQHGQRIRADHPVVQIEGHEFSPPGQRGVQLWDAREHPAIARPEPGPHGHHRRSGEPCGIRRREQLGVRALHQPDAGSPARRRHPAPVGHHRRRAGLRQDGRLRPRRGADVSLRFLLASAFLRLSG